MPVHTRRISSVIALLLCLSSAPSQADLAISPANVEVKLDKGRAAGEFVITNLGDREERYRIQSIHFTFARNGSLDKIEPDEHSLATWIVFNPREFTLPGKTRRVVRFVVVPKGRLQPGEYWAGMEMESLNTVLAETQDEKGRKFKLEIVPKILVPMFGQFGKVEYSGVARDTKVAAVDNTPTINTIVANTGNGRLHLTGQQYEVADSNGRIVEKGSLSRSNAYVLPKLEREFQTPIKEPMPAGRYRLRIRYDCSQLQQPLKDEIEFDWAPPAAKAGIPTSG